MASQQTQHKDVVAIATDILELSKKHAANVGTFEPAVLLKANELIAAVRRPQDSILSWSIQAAEASAFKSLLSFGAIQAIPLQGSLSIKELESITGAQASLLLRLFRVLVAGNIINVNTDGTYSHTPFSTVYAKSEDAVSYFNALYEEVLAIPSLPEYFRQRGAKEPTGLQSQRHNPRTWYYGKEGRTVFEIYEDDPVKLKDFQLLMTMSKTRPYTGYYDFEKLATEEADRMVIVDVGGAEGTAIAKILEAFPSIKPEQCVVQDLKPVIELTRSNANLPPNVHLQAYDFFTSQPVKHARAYLLRSICHDWSDESAITILSRVAAAAAKDTKILIADKVLPEEGKPSPMSTLPDMIMLCISGKERTRSGFENLLDQAGLKLDGIYPSGDATGFSIVEASLK